MIAYAFDWVSCRLYDVYGWVKEDGIITHVELITGTHPIHNYTYFYSNLN